RLAKIVGVPPVLSKYSVMTHILIQDAPLLLPFSFAPTLHQFFQNLFQRYSYIPTAQFSPHFFQIGDITDMVTFTVLLNILIPLALPGNLLYQRKGFQNGTAVLSSSTN